jgi:hypothetical protein
MATASKTTTASVTTDAPASGDAWDLTKLPTSDEEFEFTDINSIPGWCDKGWAGYDQGPALQLPRDLTFKGPYSTITAHIGDKVVFTAAKGAKAASFTVIQKDVSDEEGKGTQKPGAVSNASLEDLLATGKLKIEDLSDDAKGQLILRNPSFAQTMGIKM